eukprot:6486647-Amphidinium_carterae.2
MEGALASASSGLSPASTWSSALTGGHRHIRLADRLLQRSWMFPVPFPVMSPVQGGTIEVVGDESAFCEMVILALYWGSGMSPDDPPAGILLGVPEAAAHGVEHVTVVESPTYYADGQEVGVARVAVVLASPPYVGQYLAESSPAEATNVSFVDDTVGALPWNAQLFSQLDIPEALSNGFWVHVALDGPSLRVLANGTLSNEEFVSVSEQENVETGQQLSILEVLNSESTRRAVSRVRRPSVAGLGSSAKMLGAVLAKAPSVKQMATPKPKGSAKAKSSSTPGTDRDVLHQILVSVQAMGERISALESPGLSSGAAFPISSSLALPSTGMTMPLQSSGMTVPMLSSGMSMPLPSSGMTMPLPPPGMSMPLPSTGMSMPLSSSGMPMPNPSSGMSMPLPMPASAEFGAGSTTAKGSMSLLAAPPGTACPASAYQDALTEARRLLGVPPSQSSVEPDVSGARGARERAVDADVRAAVMRGGQDAQTAMNIAFLDVLDRVGRKSGSAMGDFSDDVNFDFLTGDGTQTDGEGKAKGAEQLTRLARAVEKAPERFAAQIDLSAAKACGAYYTRLPWTMELYAERNIRFHRLEGHERMFALLAHLHGLSRAGQHALLSARIGQFLKAVEPSVQSGGSWKLAWLLTGLPEIRSQSANMIGRGLGLPAEYSATVAYVRDMNTIEQVMAKAEQGQGGAAQQQAGAATGGTPAAPKTPWKARPKGGKGNDPKAGAAPEQR